MKPKLLLVSDTYHPLVDGTVVFIDEFIKRAKDSFEISLLAPALGKDKNDEDARTILLETTKNFQPLPTYPSIKFSLRNLRLLKEAVRQADLVFIQGPALASYLAMYFAPKYHKKTIAYIHILSWELFEKSSARRLAWLTPWLKKICLFFYNRCDEILVPYHELKGYLEEEGIRSRIAVARLGVDVNRFSPALDKRLSKQKIGLDPGQQVIGYVGRISKEKNTPILLEAFQKLPRQENLQLLMVGDGPPEQVKDFRRVKNCLITGFVPNVPDYLKAMDVFVMPSLTETTSLATLEAMSSGLPVIATKVGFIKRYIVKGQNGLFFPRNSSALLAAKMEKVLKDRELRQKLGRNARQTVTHSFSWEHSLNKIKKKLLELYYTI